VITANSARPSGQANVVDGGFSLRRWSLVSGCELNGTAKPFKIIANEKDGRIPAAARFSLDVFARQHAAIATEIKLSRSASVPGIVQVKKLPARTDPWRWAKVRAPTENPKSSSIRFICHPCGSGRIERGPVGT
jgi:hypothetical protein